MDGLQKELFQSIRLTGMEAPCLGALNFQAVCNLHQMFLSFSVHPVTKTKFLELAEIRVFSWLIILTRFIP